MNTCQTGGSIVERILLEIREGPLPRAFLVHGSELFWHHQILKALKGRILAEQLPDWNWSVFYGNKDFEEGPLLAELATVPWGGTTKIVVLREANQIPAATLERVAQWMEDHPQANCLALFLEQLDQRLRFVKILGKLARVISCAPLQGEDLLRYIQDYCRQHGKRLPRPAAELFLERVGSSLLFIHNELEKLFVLTGEELEIREADIRSLTSFSPAQIAKNTVFQMTDFLVQGKRQEALQVLEVLLKAGEPPLRILPLIERQLRLVLAAKTTTAPLDETARQMGENSSFALKKIKPYAKNYTLEKIFADFAAVTYADREMKLGAPGDQVLAELIVRLT